LTLIGSRGTLAAPIEPLVPKEAIVNHSFQCFIDNGTRQIQLERFAKQLS
jgi:hypothetical protein